jgi:hypothetical protein
MPVKLAEAANPVVYEINTWAWLATVGAREGAQVTSATSPIATGTRSLTANPMWSG